MKAQILQRTTSIQRVRGETGRATNPTGDCRFPLRQLLVVHIGGTEFANRLGVSGQVLPQVLRQSSQIKVEGEVVHAVSKDIVPQQVTAGNLLNGCRNMPRFFRQIANLQLWQFRQCFRCIRLSIEAFQFGGIGGNLCNLFVCQLRADTLRARRRFSVYPRLHLSIG